MRDIDFSTMFYGYRFVQTGSVFRITYSNGWADEFRGSGFRYANDGTPTDGTVKSYAIFSHSSRLAVVDGLNVSVTKIVDAAETFSTADDFRLIKNAMSGKDLLVGGQGDDVAFSYGGNDRLLGKGGNDILKGGDGNDTLTGGAGRDIVSGEKGADTFVFTRTSESNTFNRDKITDFSQQQNDTIDLSAIDANESARGNQAFKFIGASEFHGKAGELRFEKQGGLTIVQGDTDEAAREAFIAASLAASINIRGADTLRSP
ncbi:M10 family metallopeptidase C-terminal domain-containing protein [Rhizobium sp. KVB221]|uniref:M10 family metallopeptidase C-terminal domain-containing protein n=1 Tax=Rhizobium setariae TaxID=2801340 RepID=A0A936YPX3_9HYPH|nr:M10 family metallopeptidase C-terminal domain-containing protein [Rhizobium setariae]MBL0374548.1 M10 family metallopeptidase C-terminal domain-containing protein [Rhizobium setariae]